MVNVKNEICKKVAKIYAGKNWHNLSTEQQELIKMLEEAGYLVPNKPENGFVGKIVFQ